MSDIEWMIKRDGRIELLRRAWRYWKDGPQFSTAGTADPLALGDWREHRYKDTFLMVFSIITGWQTWSWPSK